MTWYNPSSWFREKLDEDIKLSCDSPQCSLPIQKEPIAYNKEQKEIFHNGRCAQFASAHRALESNKMIFVNLNYISLNKALKLFNRGKLNQSSKLEKSLT